MITDADKKFMAYWVQQRNKQKRLVVQLFIGLPIGLIFATPVLVNYLSGWYKRANMIGNSQVNPIILIGAMLSIATFVAIFYKKHQWNMHEQRYKTLQHKIKNNKNAVCNAKPNALNQQ